MARYKYFIKKDGVTYYFGLYPGNNNKQAIGISGKYRTYQEAKDAIVVFQKLIKESSNPNAIFDIFKENRKFGYNLIENEYAITFSRVNPLLEKRYSIRNTIQRVIENIDAPLRFYAE